MVLEIRAGMGNAENSAREIGGELHARTGSRGGVPGVSTGPRVHDIPRSRPSERHPFAQGGEGARPSRLTATTTPRTEAQTSGPG